MSTRYVVHNDEQILGYFSVDFGDVSDLLTKSQKETHIQNKLERWKSEHKVSISNLKLLLVPDNFGITGIH